MTGVVAEASGSGSGPAARPAAASPAAARRPNQRADVVTHDQLFGLLACAMWSTWALKLAPQVSSGANVQSAAGLVAIVLVSLAWPTLHAASYRRHRTLALSALRMLLICLPFNYERDVLDVALPQQLETGRLSSLVNLSHLISASHLDFLLFTSLGWRLPLRAHMALQAAMVAILACFGVHPHCSGKLLSSPEVGSLVRTAHSVLGLLVSVLVPSPPALAVVPGDGYGQTVALLLLSWLLIGWVLPTLLLLRPVAAAAAASWARRGDEPGEPLAASQGSSCSRGLLPRAAAAADRVARVVEAALSSLLPGHPQLMVVRGQHHAMDTSPLVVPGVLTLGVRWLLLIVPLWLLCCSVAPMYSPAPA